MTALLIARKMPDGPSGAVMSRCGKYRFLLWRRWGTDPVGRMLCWIMLNPSTADHEKSDPTVTRCMNYAYDWNYDGIFVVNLFAWRATDSDELGGLSDPVGPDNDAYIIGAAATSTMTIAAWGTLGNRGGRCGEVQRLLREHRIEYRLNALGICNGGEPRHPLYLRKSDKPAVWPGCTHFGSEQ